MREIRSSGSVEGVTCNRDPYSDCEVRNFEVASLALIPIRASFERQGSMPAVVFWGELVPIPVASGRKGALARS